MHSANRSKLRLAAALALYSAVARAATITWDGGAGSLSWEDGANWSSDARPASADTVVFHDTGFGPGTDYTILTNADQTITVLRFGTTGANAQALTKNLTIAGNTITLLGNPTNNNTLNGTAQATGSLTVSSNLLLSTANGVANFNRGGSALLTVTGNVGEASASNPQSLHKTGAGTIALSGGLSYSAGTFVEAGTLLVNGPASGGGPFSASGGTLGGTGVLGGNVTIADDGTLAPGAGAGKVGTLRVGGDVDLRGTLTVDLAGAAAAGGGAAAADLLDVSGALNLGPGATLLFDPASTFDGTTHVVGKYTSLTGTFANVLNLPEGYSLEYGVSSFSVVATPEPGTLALLPAAGAGLLERRRRR
jgi:fibronectin-binding autotransporter adhesin